MHTHHHHHGPSGHGFAGRRRGFASFFAEAGIGHEPGAEFRFGRFLGGGDLRLVVLLLLEEGPRHGYDLIKAIEEKSAGIYSPSPGVIYPALTYLEEAGFAQSKPDANKKIFEITEDGRAHLDAHRAEAEAVLEGLTHIGKRAEFMRTRLREKRARFEEGADRDIPGVLPEVNAARKALKSAIAAAIKSDQEGQKRLADILNRATAEINSTEIDL